MPPVSEGPRGYYGLDGTTIVIRAHPGATVRAASHAHVTFEVDEIDRRTRSGWSLLVRGQAEEVDEEHRPDLVASTHAAGTRPWAPGEHGNWLRIVVQQLTGRRIVPGELPAAVEPRAYL